MSWLILSCSMQLITSGYFHGTEDCNYSPVKANAALTSLITVEKEEWRGQVDRCCLSMSSVNDAFVALWEELSSYEEESYHTKWTVSCNSNFFENFLWQSFPSYGIAMGTVIEEFPAGITHGERRKMLNEVKKVISGDQSTVSSVLSNITFIAIDVFFLPSSPFWHFLPLTKNLWGPIHHAINSWLLPSLGLHWLIGEALQLWVRLVAVLGPSEGMWEAFCWIFPGCKEMLIVQEMPGSKCRCESALWNPSLNYICPPLVDFLQQGDKFRSLYSGWGGSGLHLTRQWPQRRSVWEAPHDWCHPIPGFWL